MLKRLPQFAVKFDFWHGAASTFDLLGKSFRLEIQDMNCQNNLEACRSDMQAIRRDFQTALNQIQKETDTPTFR
jgi:hypothetical protein